MLDTLDTFGKSSIGDVTEGQFSRSAPPSAANTGAVVITHQPGEEFLQLLAATATQVARMVVVDNQTDAETRKMIVESCEAYGATLIANSDNRGVAAALNQGISEMLAYGEIEWVLLLDQDSIPNRDLVNRLSVVYLQVPDQSRIGILGANYVERGSGNLGFAPGIFGDKTYITSTSFQTSGTLLRGDAFRAMGRMREQFFIYWVDVEYCLRLKKSGMKVIVSREVLMSHATGKSLKKRVFGVVIHHTSYPPNRYYYLARNQLVVLREYSRQYPRWALWSIRYWAIKILKALILEPGRVDRVISIFYGLRDGIRMDFSYSPIVKSLDNSCEQ